MNLITCILSSGREKSKQAYLWRKGVSDMKIKKRWQRVTVSSAEQTKVPTWALGGPQKLPNDQLSVSTVLDLIAAFETIDCSTDFQDATLSLFFLFHPQLPLLNSTQDFLHFTLLNFLKLKYHSAQSLALSSVWSTHSCSDLTKACRFKCHLHWCLPHLTSLGLISPLEVQIQNPTAFLIPLCDCLIGTSNLYLKLSSILHLPVFPISLNNFILSTTTGLTTWSHACLLLFSCFLQPVFLQTLLTLPSKHIQHSSTSHTSPKDTVVQAFIILNSCTTIMIWTGYPATALSSLGVFWQHSRCIFVCFFFPPKFLVNVSINLFSVFLKNKNHKFNLII